MVTLQTKALKAFPYPNLATIAAIDTHAADAAIERTRFDQQTACNAEQLRFAHEARSTIKDDNSLKNTPEWLRANTHEQHRKTHP